MIHPVTRPHGRRLRWAPPRAAKRHGDHDEDYEPDLALGGWPPGDVSGKAARRPGF